MLFVLIVLAHDRRRMVYFNVIEHPTGRWIGSCRRDLLDHIIALNELHLRRLIWDYISYYHSYYYSDRTRDSFKKDSSAVRPVSHKPDHASALSFNNGACFHGLSSGSNKGLQVNSKESSLIFRNNWGEMPGICILLKAARACCTLAMQLRN
jgi:hypothetical protein